MIDYYDPNLDLILLGCGFLGGYHVGAIHILAQIWPKRPYERISGASSGGILGAALVSGLDLDRILESAMNIIRLARRIVNPFQMISVKNLVYKTLNDILPENAHKICSGRFGLTLTYLWTWDWIFVSDFESRRDLIDAAVAGSFIPVWSGSVLPIKCMGSSYVDGGFTNNWPKFEMDPEEEASGRKSIAICPFPCNAQVSPPLDSWWAIYSTVGVEYKIDWESFSRGFHALIPCKLSTYKKYLKEGHRHMKDYLLTNRLIMCKNCYASYHQKLNHADITKTMEHGCIISKVTSRNSDKSNENHHIKACLLCLKLMEKVDSLKVDDKLLRLMDD